MLKSELSGNTVIITRELDTPRQFLWRAWTEADLIEQWWGPEGFQTSVAEMNVHPGGRWSYVMTAPGGAAMAFHGVFHEVIQPERLTMTLTPDFENPIGSFDEMVNLEELGGYTRLTVRMIHAHEDLARVHVEAGLVAGWESTFRRLDQLLARLSA